MKKTIIQGALALTVLLSPMVWAQADLPRVESFFQNPSLQSVVLSPSGKYIAMLTLGAEGRQMLAVAPTEDVSQAIPVSGSRSIDVVRVEWINDNRLFLQIADLQHEGASADWNSYAVNRDGSQFTQLTSGNWEFNQENTGSNIKKRTLPADYRFYSTLSDGSDDVIVSKYTYNNVDYRAESQRLYRLNTITRNLKDMLDGTQPAKVLGWVLDRQDQPRLAISYDKGRRRVHMRDRQTNGWTELGNFDAAAGEGWSPQFFDFNDNFYVRVSHGGGTSSLYRYDLEKKHLADEPTISVEGFDFSGEPEVDTKAKKLLGIHFKSDALGTAWIDPQFAEIQKMLDAALPGAVNTITCGFCTSSPTLLVKSESDRQPSQYFLYKIAEKRLLQLGSSHPDIRPEQMGARDFVHYTARDGLKIPAYITTPPGKSSGPWPTVVLVHGGPYVRGSSWEWDDEAQFLASRGYLVIQPEFRGSTGFGFKHFHAGWKQWGMAMQDDLADAAKWAIAKGMADPKRIAIAGASYGGYAALMGLAKNPELFRAGFEWVGVTDINLMFSVDNTQMSDASLEWLRYGAKTLIGDPVKDAELFKANSPLEMADRITQPLLMAYGGKDMRVPIIHGTTFRNAVSKTNKQVEWITYGEEGHGWKLEKNRVDFWKRVEVFLEKNLKSPG
ncbi:S9 family peptidase [Chitinimonas naiadis]